MDTLEVVCSTGNSNAADATAIRIANANPFTGKDGSGRKSWWMPFGFSGTEVGSFGLPESREAMSRQVGVAKGWEQHGQYKIENWLGGQDAMAHQRPS